MHDLVNDRSLTPPIDSNINEKNPRLIEDLQRENEQMTRLRQTQEWMRLQNLCIGGASVKSQPAGPPRQVRKTILNSFNSGLNNCIIFWQLQLDLNAYTKVYALRII